MSKIIWQNGPKEVTEVIYDTICGMSIEKAIEVLEQYKRKRLIPVEWIEKFMNKFATPQGVCGDEYVLLHYMLTEWECENAVTD